MGKVSPAMYYETLTKHRFAIQMKLHEKLSPDVIFLHNMCSHTTALTKKILKKCLLIKIEFML